MLSARITADDEDAVQAEFDKLEAEAVRTKTARRLVALMLILVVARCRITADRCRQAADAAARRASARCAQCL
jgi:hypothetical protein